MRTISNTLYRFDELSEQAKAVAIESERYRRGELIRDQIHSVIIGVFEQFDFDFDSISFELGAVVSFDWLVPQQELIQFARNLMEPIDSLDFAMLCEDRDFTFNIHNGDSGMTVTILGDSMLPADSFTRTLLQILKEQIQGQLRELVLIVNKTLRSELAELYSDKAMLDSITACGIEYLASGTPWNRQFEFQAGEKSEQNEITLEEGDN
jgi:hypothetical protein